MLDASSPSPGDKTMNTQAVAKSEQTAVAGIGDLIQQLVMQPGFDVSKLREILELQREVRRDEAAAAYNEAMNAAQEEMRAVSQDASNPQTRSKYVSYAALDKAIRPLYTKHGFGLSFDTADGAPEGHVRVVCKVSCGGHSEFPHIDLPADGKGAKGGDVMTKTHATMSAITYGKRALLKMIFNIAESGAEDDDGNAAGNDAITEDEVATLRQKIIDLDADLPKVLAFNKVGRLEELTSKQYKKAIAALEDWARKAGHK